MSNRMVLTPKPDYTKLARDLVGKAELLEYATEIITDIRDRTQSGLDYKNNSFKEYSEDYAEKKGVVRSDVTLTGITAGDRMLLEMHQYATETESVIHFPDANKNDLAYKHMKGIGVPKRLFFEFSKEDEKEIQRMYNEDLDKAIRKWERS